MAGWVQDISHLRFHKDEQGSASLGVQTNPKPTPDGPQTEPTPCPNLPKWIPIRSQTEPKPTPNVSQTDLSRFQSDSKPTPRGIRSWSPVEIVGSFGKFHLCSVHPVQLNLSRAIKIPSGGARAVVTMIVVASCWKNFVTLSRMVLIAARSQ